MRKVITKTLLSILGMTLSVGLFTFSKSNNSNITTEASVGSYNRNQATYYTSDFTHKVTSSAYGSSLLSTLHELMYETHKTYNTYDDLWTYTKDTDYDIDNPDNIILIYSRQSVNGVQNSDVWNREHVWCRSLSGGLYGTSTGPGSDLHHLRPSSTNYNSTRGNTPYGIIATHDASTRMGDTDCYMDSNNFEPADYIKGDVARVLMYMYTHYSTEISGTAIYTEGTLSITNIVNKSTAQQAWDLLMDWNESDPVDYQEMIRNNKCAELLGNYNPFIDHPEFARMIWDDSSTQQTGLFFQTSYKTVNVGSSYTNTASKYGRVSTSGDIVYTSDNPSIATVNSSTGQVTGVSNGVVRIKARCTINGVSKISYHFVVVGSGYTPKHTVNASGIVYTPTSKTTAVASEKIGSETVTYSNTKGISQITKDNSFTLTINNFPRTVSSIKLYLHSNQSSGTGTITVTVGGSQYSSKSGTFQSIYGNWSQSFVPVDFTNANASKKTGTIVITGSCSVNSLYFQKAVIDYAERTIVKTSSISVSPSSISLTPGEDNILTTTFTPSNTTLQTVTWLSSNNSVATVNKYGLVRAIANGNAVITATASDGSGRTATTSVTVSDSVAPSEPTVTGVTVSPSSTSLDVYNNPTTTLTAVVDGTNNPSQSVTWSVYSSSPSGCAEVNNTGTVTAIKAGTAVIRATSVADNTKYGSCTVTITDSAPVVTSISATVSKTYYVGDVITTTDISVEDNLGNSINTFTFTNDNYQFTYSDASSGGELTSKTFINSIIGAGKTCSLTVQVQRKAREQVGTVSDVLDVNYTGRSGTTYGSWDPKDAPSSSAKYAGNNAAGNSSIQLRSGTSSGSDVHAGIVSTVSGGNISSVSVTWNSNTASGRTLNVYGKNTAYSTPNDLYDNNNKGTLLGTIIKGTSTTLNVTGSYLYVGICSNSGAMYLTDVTFTYGSSDTASNVANYIMYEDTPNQCNTKYSVAKGYFEGLSVGERNTFMTSNDYVIATARNRFTNWAKHFNKTIDYVDNDYVISNSQNINLTALSISDSNNSIIIITMSLISITALGAFFFIKKKKEN